MKEIIILLLLSLSLISCSKKHEIVKEINSFSDVNELFQLKNYKTQIKMYVNDSTDHVTAQWDNFILTGNLDTKMNAKTGIWNLKNKINTKEIQIDYIAFDKNDVFKNQIIFKEHNKIDSSVSKFFIIKNKTENELAMKFFSPSMRDEISKRAKIIYTIHQNRKEIKTDSIVYDNLKGGKYSAVIKYNFKKGDDVSGYFSEIVMAKSPMDKDSLTMGNNSMYFIEKF